MEKKKEAGNKETGQKLGMAVKTQTAEEKIYAEMNEQIELAEKAGSFMVAITRKEGEKLFHWQGTIRFPQEDIPHSLRKHLQKVPNTQKETGNVRRFGPPKD